VADKRWQGIKFLGMKNGERGRGEINEKNLEHNPDKAKWD
jgi:hypothetical protein